MTRPLARCAVRAWPFLLAAARAGAGPGAIVVGPAGEVVRLDEDGSATPILPPGHPRPGIAGDPCAALGARP